MDSDRIREPGDWYHRMHLNAVETHSDKYDVVLLSAEYVCSTLREYCC